MGPAGVSGPRRACARRVLSRDGGGSVRRSQPGSGKTRTLTHRIAYQIRAGGRPASQFLAITFTRRAAEEMRQRLAVLLGDDQGGADQGGAGRAEAGAGRGQVTVTTFHGLGLRILREHHEAAGLSGAFGVADGAATLAVATSGRRP